MASGTIGTMNTGEQITIGELCVQLVFLAFFWLTSAIFHTRIRSNQRSELSNKRSVPIKPHFGAGSPLFAGCILPYTQGNGGYLISHENKMSEI
ncbi:hypothetical protein N7467_000009 [Penicillium canescens]|nr:hypothetical protein N7467_000009 [Penicillium canescens]